MYAVNFWGHEANFHEIPIEAKI